MQIRTFRVPFSRVVGDEAHELDFGPEDYLVVRPVFGLSRTEVQGWAARVAEVAEADDAAKADQLILDLLGEAVIEWHLGGSDGKPIEKPGTVAALNALPGAVAGSLFAFLSSYRGEAPNPTTRS